MYNKSRYYAKHYFHFTTHVYKLYTVCGSSLKEILKAYKSPQRFSATLTFTRFTLSCINLHYIKLV